MKGFMQEQNHSKFKYVTTILEKQEKNISSRL